MAVSQFSVPMHAEPDAYARVNTAVGILKSRNILNTEVQAWLPFHATLIAIPLMVLYQPLIIPQLVTIFFHLFSISGVYFLTRALFDENLFQRVITKQLRWKIGSQTLKLTDFLPVIATILYLLFPQRILISTAVLTEPLIVSSVVWAVWALVKRRYAYFILLINVCHMVRYETWQLMPLLGLVILLDKNLQFVKKLLILLLSVTFPILWMIGGYVQHHDFLWFLTQKKLLAHEYAPLREYGNLALTLKSWIRTSFEIVPKTGILLYFVGFIWFFKQKIEPRVKVIALIPWYWFALLVLQVYAATMEVMPHRYLFIPITLSLPYVAFAIWQLCKYVHMQIRYKFIFFAVLMMILLYSAVEYVQVFRLTKERISIIYEFSALSEFVRFYNSWRRTAGELARVYYYGEPSLFAYLSQDLEVISYVGTAAAEFARHELRPGTFAIIERQYYYDTQTISAFRVIFENRDYIMVEILE